MCNATVASFIAGAMVARLRSKREVIHQPCTFKIWYLCYRTIIHWLLICPTNFWSKGMFGVAKNEKSPFATLKVKKTLPNKLKLFFLKKKKVAHWEEFLREAEVKKHFWEKVQKLNSSFFYKITPCLSNIVSPSTKGSHTNVIAKCQI